MKVNVLLLCGVIWLIAFFITVLFTPISIRWAHKIGAIDLPSDGRRVHKKPIPRLGGVAVFVGFTVAALLIFGSGLVHPENIDTDSGIATISFFKDIDLHQKGMPILGAFLGSIVIFIFGIVDDLKELGAWTKLLGQILGASVAFGFGVRITFFDLIFDYKVTNMPIIVSGIVTVLWIVAITNTINLIDGLDGLAAGVVGISSLCIAYIGYIHGHYLGAFPMLAIAGAALGFLVFNYHPAKTFMGDCGSQYLGYLLATFSILGSVKSATLVAVFVPAMSLALPIFDTIFAIVRRMFNGQPIMAPDKGHLHHRLLRSGLGQRRSVLVIYGISGIMGVASVLLSRKLYVETVGLVGVAIIYIYVVITNPTNRLKNVREQRESRNQERRLRAQLKSENKGKKSAKAGNS